MSDCLVVSAVTIESKSQAEMDHHRQGIGFECPLILDHCLLKPSQRCKEIECVADSHERRNRIDGHRRLKMTFRRVPIVFNRTGDQSQYTMRLAQGRIDGQRFFRRRLGQRGHFDHPLDAESPKTVIKHRQPGVRGSITGIVHKGLFEGLLRFDQTLRIVALIPIQSLQVTLESFDVCCAPLRARQLNFHGIRNRLRNIILNGKNIDHLTIIPFRPEMRFIVYLDELSGDPNAIARSSDAAFENGSYSESLTDDAQILFLAAKSKRRRASNYPQLLHLGKSIDNLFSQAVAEVLVLLVSAEVHKGEHSNRLQLFLGYDRRSHGW